MEEKEKKRKIKKEKKKKKEKKAVSATDIFRYRKQGVHQKWILTMYAHVYKCTCTSKE